ncbi:hypothetical protein D8W71_11375 [Rhodococcus sp. P1Y]|nr:hypothetical protein D8W71_11375 [Rhodococcus sp. P1Y]
MAQVTQECQQVRLWFALFGRRCLQCPQCVLAHRRALSTRRTLDSGSADDSKAPVRIVYFRDRTFR